MQAKHNLDGVILNARGLSADEVIGERVLSLSGDDKVFQLWPEGWDANAAYKCTGSRGVTLEEGKSDFKQRFGYLFR